MRLNSPPLRDNIGITRPQPRRPVGNSVKEKENKEIEVACDFKFRTSLVCCDNSACVLSMFYRFSIMYIFMGQDL